MDFTEKRLSSEFIFDGKIVHLYKDEILLPDGNKSTREVIKHQGAVCIVAVDDEKNVYIVRQFRYPFSSVITEIPAGKLEKGEDPLGCAKRELLEETGMNAQNFTLLGKFYSSPAFLDEVIYMYLATDLSKEEQHLDEDEFVEVDKIKIDDLVKKIMDGEIPDGKTQAAVLKAYYSLR